MLVGSVLLKKHLFLGNGSGCYVPEQVQPFVNFPLSRSRSVRMRLAVPPGLIESGSRVVLRAWSTHFNTFMAIKYPNRAPAASIAKNTSH